MQTNVLEYLEKTAMRLPRKIAFANEETGMSFHDVFRDSRAIGSFLHQIGLYKQPVVIFMKRRPKAIAAFFGAVYGGDFYVPIDEEMPRHRIELILRDLSPKAMICDETTADLTRNFHFTGDVYRYDEIVKTPVNDEVLMSVRDRAIDTDPIYVVFTSGSTGIPKGVAACHRSVLDYIESLSDVMRFNESTVFGNQTPLYFDACLKELYPTLKFGATTYLIPKFLFMFPVKLVEFLNAYQINTVCWVASALTMISAFRTFDIIRPQSLHTVAFGSEVFPIRQLNLWRAALPEARFVNLYGPTEATGMCCYFEVNRPFSEDEALPVGRPFRNTEILLLNEQNQVPTEGDPGEICIRGTSLTLGYINNFEKTKEVFVQNPLNTRYPELIYRTGDIGRYNDRGELLFLSRKDYQIKHMGHRIELGEIEAVVNMLEGVKSACCLFDDKSKKIILYYVGESTPAETAAYLKEKLPRYMVPNVIEELDRMPLAANGKINRTFLKRQYGERNK